MSIKLVPCCCVNPLATSQALCRSRVPSALYLILKICLQSTGLFPSGRETMVQVLLLFKASSYVRIACRQTGEASASERVVGSCWEEMAQT